MKKSNKVFAALLIALGLAVGGFFPGYYYYKTHADFRSVTVKGLAEKDVVADMGLWNIQFTVNNNDLNFAQKQIGNQAKEIVQFLQKQGFTDTEIHIGRIETNDLMANPYRDNNAAETSRFILTQTISIRSSKVYAIASAMSLSNELIAKGIVFSNQSANYFFTKLNEIKPEMLKQATENAKEAALEFARNSGSKVGKINKANQGVFSIQSRDDANAYEALQIEKRVRVVSTVEYLLED
ncbi:MAG: SIMPL domain-containing protein [Alphaproteobacteria bacterium]|nr:SIMPL domain-containing protein [Alphaproteobacteria bacterium]